MPNQLYDRPGDNQSLAGVAELYKFTAHILQPGDLNMLVNIFQKVHNTILITDSDRNIFWANKSFLTRAGYRLAEIQGKKPHEFLFDPFACTASENDSCVELHCRSKSGQYYWLQVEISPIYNQENSIKGYTAVGTDITERKSQEEKIKTRHRLLTEKLTRRELEVLEAIREGLSYNEIGTKLFISSQTVNQHIKSIYRKMEVDTRAKLVAKIGAGKI
jgi:PAS domain S-box-containing protein